MYLLEAGNSYYFIRIVGFISSYGSYAAKYVLQSVNLFPATQSLLPLLRCIYIRTCSKHSNSILRLLYYNRLTLPAFTYLLL